MQDNTRKHFRTVTQYKRWLAYRDYFTNIIKLQQDGVDIWVNDCDGNATLLGEIYFNVVPEWNDGKDEVHIMERNSPTSSTWIVGCTHDIEGGEWLHVNDTLKQWLTKNKPRRYSQVEYL